MALAVGWCVCAIVIRRHYLDMFRGRIYRGEGFNAFPDLDMASLETLISALDSGNENEVVAALEVLESEGKPGLVPSFILYHPSEQVIDRALALFVHSGRASTVPVAERLLEHPSAHVRAAAVGATSILAFDERRLRQMLSHEESAEVRASIMVNLIASGKIVGSDARDALDAIVLHGKPAAKVALVQAIAGREATGFDDTLTRLAADQDPAVRLSVARAVGKLHSSSLLPVLVKLLMNEQTRTVARSNLVGFGREGIEYLTQALCDPSVDSPARWQIPLTLVMFGSEEEVAPFLLERLIKDSSGMVRFRCILALENMVEENPQLKLDRTILDQAIASTVARAYRYLDRRVALEQATTAQSKPETDGYALLRSALHDKETNAIDRVFRLLDLSYRNESFDEIRAGLDSGSAEARASSLELIENIIAPPLRAAIIGLVDDVDDVDDRERLSHSRPYHSVQPLDLEGVLRQIVKESSSIAIRAIAIFHIGELGLAALRPELLRIIGDGGNRGAAESLGPDVALALERIERGGVSGMGSGGSR
jgi:HEAT repeat protein